MSKYRSIFAAILAVAVVVLLSFGGVAEAKRVAKPPSYTSEQIAQIQEYASELSAIKDRLPELADLIQKQDWVFVRNFIHGPLGELRAKMAFASQNLLGEDQKQARAAAKTVVDNLVAIDQAAQAENYKLAIRNYAETVRDLDNFLSLLPKGS
jgi:photosystem II protein PsbQ